MGTLIGLSLGIGLFCCYWACWTPRRAGSRAVSGCWNR